MQIINLGSLNIDKIYSVNKIVKPGETIDSIDYHELPGGKGLNQSVAIARAGSFVMHAGYIGNDGDILSEKLRDSGVDTSLLKKLSKPSGQAIIQVDRYGQNCIILYHGTNYCISTEYVSCVLNNLESGDILVLQNEISNLSDIICCAHDKEIDIYLNPSPINEELKKCDFSMLKAIFVNEHEGAYLSGQSDINAILDTLSSKYANLEIILTHGSKGAYYQCGKTAIFQPSFKVDALDTTAAGDTFTGYFIALRQQGYNIKDCMRLSARAASIAVTKQGAADSIPNFKDVLYAEKI